MSAPTGNLDKLRDYDELGKKLFALADKATVEQVCRLLAIHIACVQKRYGSVAMDDSLAALHADDPSAEQIEILENGMETLVAFLTLASDVADQSDVRN